jgi:hypothetical protein
VVRIRLHSGRVRTRGRVELPCHSALSGISAERMGSALFKPPRLCAWPMPSPTKMSGSQMPDQSGSVSA